MFTELFSIITPVFLCVGIGVVWGRQGRPFDTAMVAAMVTALGVPCLAFSSLVKVAVPAAAIGTVALAAGAALMVFAAVGALVLAVSGLGQRAYLGSLIFANTGNVGLPLCLLAFGDHGLALAIGYFAVSSVSFFTVGVAIAAGTASLKSLVRNQTLWAVAAAIAFLATGTRPPEWVYNTTKLLAGMSIPLMLITLGVSLAKLRVHSLGRGVFLGVFKVGLGFATGLAVAEILGLDGAERGVVIILSSMPSAVFNYLLAQRYHTDPQGVAAMVVASTVFAFAVLPLVLWVAL